MTEEVITPEVVETVDAAPAEPVADAPVVAADPVQPDAPAAVEEVAEVVAEVVAEPVAEVVAVKPLSDSAQTVLAWIKSMAAVAPHHSQVTFETFLAQNIASLDEFDAALGD